MSKKKRNKQHKSNVAATRPVITKVSAIKRNPVHQWWVDRRKYIRPALPVIGIVVVVILVVLGLISIIWPR